MEENMQKLIEELKEKKFIFVNGFPGFGKTTLINILKQRKEFENYDFELSTDYYCCDKEKFFSLELDKPKFIEIRNIEDIDFLTKKAKNPERVIRNFWRSGIVISLNISGHIITDLIGDNFYAYAYIEKIIPIENFSNNKTLDIYITNLDQYQRTIKLFKI